jgi:hypothetical protein
MNGSGFATSTSPPADRLSKPIASCSIGDGSLCPPTSDSEGESGTGRQPRLGGLRSPCGHAERAREAPGVQARRPPGEEGIVESERILGTVGRPPHSHVPLIRMTLSKTTPSTRTRAEHLRPDRRDPQVLDIALEVADEQGSAVSRGEWGRTARRHGGLRAEVGGNSIVAADPAPVLTAAVARGLAQIADRFAYRALPGYL